MPKSYTCIAIDDDPLMLRKLEVYVEDIPWLNFLEGQNHPVKGATAIITHKPDIIFLDIEMPYIDGHYVIDWLGPHLETLELPPQIVVISSLHINKEDEAKGVAGYINKATVKSPEALEEQLKAILTLED